MAWAPVHPLSLPHPLAAGSQSSGSATRVVPASLFDQTPHWDLEIALFLLSFTGSSLSFFLQTERASSQARSEAAVLSSNPQNHRPRSPRSLCRSFHCLLPFLSILHQTLDPFRLNRGIIYCQHLPFPPSSIAIAEVFLTKLADLPYSAFLSSHALALGDLATSKKGSSAASQRCFRK